MLDNLVPNCSILRESVFAKEQQSTLPNKLPASLERYRESLGLHYPSSSACVAAFRRILRELAELTEGSSLRLFTEDRY